MSPHLWLRAETRASEARTGLMPAGAAALRARGFRVTVEQSEMRALPDADYRRAGCEMVPAGDWRSAPPDALVLGLKELPDDGAPLRHRHILFGHAFKGQAGAGKLLGRFRAGGGVLYDIESLVDDDGRRVAAFGYWAGYAGAAVALMAFAAQARGGIAGPLARFPDRATLIRGLRAALPARPPRAIVIGALGRVGRGAADLCAEAGVPVTGWDIAETAHGGPFPEILAHEILLNCILARPGTPAFVAADAGSVPRALRVVGDIACDPDAPYSPIRVNDRITGWEQPARRVHEAPPLDVVAIDNLPALMPEEASADFAAQFLPHLHTLDRIEEGVWARARAAFERHAPPAGPTAQPAPWLRS
jgi:saccharopine dehydrogenase (NAD+, L-lysine-forming)